jgi:integrase
MPARSRTPPWINAFVFQCGSQRAFHRVGIKSCTEKRPILTRLSTFIPIAEVTSSDLLRIMIDVRDRGASSYACLIRQWASAIFRHGVITQRNKADPAAALSGVIAREDVKHSRALTRDELSSLLKAIEAYHGEPSTVFGLKLLLLTFVRAHELRGARWPEINFSAAEWHIPADRMKNREKHIVPLSRQALGILEDLRDFNGHRDFVFPNTTDSESYMSSGALNRALANMGFGIDGIGFSTNGFRATASTMLADAGFRPDIIELQLSHREHGFVRSDPNGASRLPERREMMQVWADMIDAIRAAS